MFDIGFAELLVLVVIAMVVIGPEKLPGVMRTVGKTVGQARRFVTGLQNQIEQEIKLDELNKKIMAETKDLSDSLNKPADSVLKDDTPAEPENTIAPASAELPEAPGSEPVTADAENKTEPQVSEKDDSQRS